MPAWKFARLDHNSKAYRTVFVNLVLDGALGALHGIGAAFPPFLLHGSARCFLLLFRFAIILFVVRCRHSLGNLSPLGLSLLLDC